jgi:hypothetical protein
MNLKSQILLIFILFFMSCTKKISEIQNQANIISSSDYENNIAKNLIDNDSINYWNSGGYGQKWIELNFQKSHNIDTIKFKNSYTSSNTSSYDILIKKEGEEYHNIFSKTEFIEAGKTITISKKCENVISIKIVLKNDSSWVALNNVKVYGS